MYHRLGGILACRHDGLLEGDDSSPLQMVRQLTGLVKGYYYILSES